MTSRDRAKHHWCSAFLIWLTLLTLATHLPQGEVSDHPVVESPDKLMHMICFGMLAFLFMCSGWIKNKWLAWAIVSTWAWVDEATQSAMNIGRPFSTQDLLSSETGIACAMIWMGSLHTTATTKILESIELILARVQHWFVLGAIAILSTIVPCVALWFVISITLGKQFNGLVMFIGIVVATVSVLYCLVKIGSFESEIVQLRKNMAPTLWGTIVIAPMVGFSVSHTFYDPWVAVLACLVVGCRIAWNRAICLQIESQNE